MPLEVLHGWYRVGDSELQVWYQGGVPYAAGHPRAATAAELQEILRGAGFGKVQESDCGIYDDESGMTSFRFT